MEVIEEGFLPLGEIALTDKELEEFLELGICVVDDDDKEDDSNE